MPEAIRAAGVVKVPYQQPKSTAFLQAEVRSSFFKTASGSKDPSHIGSSGIPLSRGLMATAPDDGFGRPVSEPALIGRPSHSRHTQAARTLSSTGANLQDRADDGQQRCRDFRDRHSAK